ncbi:MAG: hypothetical protein IKZ37_07765 [Bacteroidaceae bacterium]|nr:hypothetical protein [Bacteroidaceae bacterium]
MNIRIVFSLVAVLLLVASCCTQRTARTASLSNSSGEVRIVRDSVFVLDSVLLRERADTVFLTRIRTLYRDRLRTDTVWRCDTVYRVEERIVVAKGEGSRLGLMMMVAALLLLLPMCRNLLKRN